MHIQGRQHPADRNVLAIFDRMEDATHAIEVLERHGIDSSDIELVGGAAERAEARQEIRHDDSPAVRHQVASIGKGAVVAALIGAVIGAPVGMGVVSLLTEDRLALGAILGGILGMIVGSFVGAARQIPFSDAWTTGQEQVAGRVGLAVGSQDPETVDRARELLEKEHPARILDLDAAEFEDAAKRI